MNKEIKIDGYISVSKIYGNNDDNVLTSFPTEFPFLKELGADQ